MIPSTEKLTEEQKEEFLDSLLSSKSVSDAVKQTGIKRKTLYSERRSDPAFRDAWDETMSAIKDELEGIAFKLATEGALEPVFYKGKIIHYKQVFHPPLLMFMLKAHKPETYSDTRESTTPEKYAQEVNGALERFKNSMS